MKKVVWLFMFLLLLLIYGCEENVEKEDALEVEQIKEQSKISENVEGEAKKVEKPLIITDWQSQYNEVLVDLLNTIGPAYNGTIFYHDSDWGMDKGIVYAELVDFDQDGNKELYVLFESVDYYELVPEHRNLNSYVHEVWQATEDGKAKLIFTGEIPKENCIHCGIGFSFLEKPDGTIVLKEAREDYGDGDEAPATFTKTFSTLENGIFNAETLEFHIGANEYMKVNGQQVTDDVYDQAVANYDLPERPIVNNEYGVYTFNFDFDSSAAFLGQFLQALNKDRNTLKSNGMKADAKIVEAVEGKVMHYIPIDVNDPSRHTEMLGLLFITYFTEWESEESKFDEFTGYSEEQVAKKFEEVYGIPLNMENIDYSGEDSSLELYHVRYQDGQFSYMAVDYEYPTVMRQVENAYEIAENTYYLELLDVEFDYFSFWAEDFEIEEPTNEQLLEPFDLWPHEMRTYGKTDIHRYAVVKIVDGNVIYRYLNYEPLSDEEMKTY